MKIIPVTLLLIVFASLGYAADPISEDFKNLHDWKPLLFPKIPKHTSYKTVVIDGISAVEMKANASASGLIAKKSFLPTDTPILSFRWRTAQTWKKGDAARKAGDDYPVRIYVTFAYNPAKASFAERLTYAAAKVRYGEYPPHSSLNYVWSNKKHTKRIIPSPYTDRAQLVILDSGDSHLNEWREHTVNILDDYRAAFGENPPKIASIAIMSDADNTGESGTAWIDYVRLTPKGPDLRVE